MNKFRAWLNAAGKTLGLWLLKSFRGLICEKKDGGWELSKGATMSWILFAVICHLAFDGSEIPDPLVWMFGGLMGYNTLKAENLKALRG